MALIIRDVDFLFTYEVRNRELDSICLLGAYLEKKGYRVGYINTWDSMYHWTPEYRAKVIVVPACYTSETYAFFTGQQALKFDKVVDLQWEQVLINMVTHSKVQTGWDFRGEGLEIRHVSWGENNREYLMERFGFSPDKTRVCGYLPLDFYRPEFREATLSREELFAKYNLDPAKKTLLFISSFSDTGKPESEIALIECDRDVVMGHIRLQEASQEKILEWFEKLAREDENIQIVYRPHPAEAAKPEFFASVRDIPNLHVIGGESIRNWILNCDILCNWQSTSMVELYASGKKTLLLRPVPIPFDYVMPIFEEGHYKAAYTYEDLVEQVHDENTEFPIEKDILMKFYSITDQPAYERLGEYLIDTLHDPNYHSRDIGGHLTWKGRILTRSKNELSLIRSGVTGRKDEHDSYFEQKMRQNRATAAEIRERLDAYKRMMGPETLPAPARPKGLMIQDVDFLFIYEVRNREIDSICLLGAYLESKGFTVAYLNTWDTMFHMNPEYRAKVAVLSACYDDATYAFFTGYAHSFEKVVNLQWEQVLMNGATQEGTKTDWDFSGEVPKKVRHICWGENNRQYLMNRYGFPAENLRVCGYLPLDFYRAEFRGATEKREKLFPRFGLDPSKKTVLFISSFADLGKPEAEQAAMSDEGLDGKDNIELQENSQKMILDWFRRLAKEHGDLQIVYRPHPAEANNETLLQCEREVPSFHVVAKESIRNWILNSDILLNWKSTSMIEAYASGKKTLVLHPTEIPFKLTMPFFRDGHFTAITCYEELEKGILEERSEFPIEKDLLLQFYSITDEPAYKRTGDYLIDTLKDPGYKSEDIGGHLSMKGRIYNRFRTRYLTRRAKARFTQMNKTPETPDAGKIREDYEYYCYYEQKMQQNRITKEELRAKLDDYRNIILK